MTDFSTIDWSDVATQQQAAQSSLKNLSDTKAETAKKSFVKKEQDFSKYFNINLTEKEKNGTKIFRMLPTLADPFQFAEKVYFHYLQVDKKWVKIYDPSQNGTTTDDSPLNNARKVLNTHPNEDVRKSAMKFKPKLFFMIRGIDRAATADGVKFWRFSAAYDNKGIMDKIETLITIYNTKKPGGGAFWNPIAGRDLVLSISRDEQKGFCAITNIIVGDIEPLSENKEEANTWLNDPTKWSDIYKTNTPYEYLDIVASGSIPVWDKDAKNGTGGYVAKVISDGTTAPIASAPVVATAPVNTKSEIENVPIVSDLLVDLPF